MMNNGDVVEINIEAMLEGTEAPVATGCCIYKVPFNIRRHNEEAYTPKVVSIGPFHNGHPRLQDMERQKLFYCNAFLRRTKTNLDSLIHEINEMEPEFRRCYSETLEFSKKQLVKIMLVDCAFILELFSRFSKKNERKNDMCLSKPWWRNNITFDLLLLENQVPYFVLEKLFNLSFPSRRGNVRLFHKRTFNFFREVNKSNLKFNDINIIRHFTDLIRTFHLPDPLLPRTDGKIMKHLPSATELSEAGLRFKVPESESCLLKLKFLGRVLEIPQLEVADGTETLFRNMVALEQCLYPSETYITDYVLFLDFLVNTNRDVDILVQARVFLNWLGDTDSVATMFNGLLKDITLPDPLPHRIDGETMEHLPSATELSEAGLRFKVLESESCLLKLDFSGRVLEITQLVVHDWTETLFRNMVALEQCLYPYEFYITDYVGFLDFLVNTNRDVDILVQERVFLNGLGDTDSVATTINGLYKDVTTSRNISSDYFSVYEKLNAFHKNRWRKLKSTLRRDYCRGPWQNAASTAAIILLILSFVQTVCSILQVIHP